MKKHIYKSITLTLTLSLLLSNFSTSCMKGIFGTKKCNKEEKIFLLSDSMLRKYIQKLQKLKCLPNIETLPIEIIKYKIFPFLSSEKLIKHMSLINKRFYELVKKHVIFNKHEDFIKDKSHIKNFFKHMLEDNFDHLVDLDKIKHLVKTINARIKNEKNIPFVCKFKKVKISLPNINFPYIDKTFYIKRNSFFDITKKNINSFKKELFNILKNQCIKTTKAYNKKIRILSRITSIPCHENIILNITRLIIPVIVKELYRYKNHKKIDMQQIKKTIKIICQKITYLLINKYKDKPFENIEIKNWILTIFYKTVAVLLRRKGYPFPFIKNKLDTSLNKPAKYLNEKVKQTINLVPKTARYTLSGLGTLISYGLSGFKLYRCIFLYPIDINQKILENYTGISNDQLNKKISDLNKKIEKAIFSTNQ
ncbi:hypothetical protein ACFLYU_01515 [Candidatus Dependentiae bacterium]